MNERDPAVRPFYEGRQRLLELVAEIRPELHRYCARMMGSVAEGEDIVQDTLARALYALAEEEHMPPLRPWLFQIAHNRALDQLRRYERRMADSLESTPELLLDEAGPEEALAREQARALAVARFVELVPLQRSVLVLKDVLGHSLEEIAQLLELSVPAVKAALHRARRRLAELGERPPTPKTPMSPLIVRYVELFNARDWDGLRSMLASDVELDLVSRAQRRGPAVSSYFTNYDAVSDWYLIPAVVEGRQAIAVRREPNGPASYYIELRFEHGLLRHIRDYRYVPYILSDAQVELSDA